MKPGKKETCYPGAPFVPLRPLHDAAMPGRRIARILRDRWDDTVKKQLLDEISELKRAANLATIHPSVLQDMKVEKKLVVRPIVLRPMDIGEVEEEGGGEEHFSIERKHRAPTSDLTPDRLSPREQSELAMAKVRADCAKADAEAEEELRGTGISAAEVEEALRREKLGVEGLPVDDEL
jgi:hypothetical protein